MRWNLIEKFEVLEKGRYSQAAKSFSGHEDFFKENYQGSPRVPEVFFIEMIAQAGGVLYGLGFDFQKEVILAKIGKAEFGKEVAPPCCLVIEALIEEEREEGAWISGTVRQGGEVAARAQILLVTIESLNGNSGKKIVFNDGFLKHFDIYNIAKKSERVAS